MSLHKPILVSAKLNLEIIFSKLPAPILAEGKVIWIQEVVKDHAYLAGVTFTKIHQGDLAFIQNYSRALDLNKILAFAASHKASDIHLTANQSPVMRVYGALVPMGIRRINPEEIKQLIYGFLNKQQIEQFEQELELDAAYTTDFGRFRVNIHKEKGLLGANFRYITTEVKSIKELGLPSAVEELAIKQTNGLILVTGPSGSGKSTTLAVMIDIINKEKDRIIMSIEDPIEYLHKSKKSIVKQREIGYDSLSFNSALKHLLRQDADVILIGEMRDLESISITLTAAETGHLVMSTLHTPDAISSINRIISSFPSNQQQQIRTQLAECLRAIISQVLIPRKDWQERVVATEILIVTPAVANLIRQGHVEQIPSSIETGSQHGMHLMDSSIERLYQKDLISREDALHYAKNPAKFIAA